MNPTTPITGDPTTDGILNWLTNGGSLSSPGAIIFLGALVKLILVPLAARVCLRFNINFSGPTKLQAVIALSTAVAFVANLLYSAHLHLGDVVLMGVHIALAAVGLHEGVATISGASKAQDDLDSFKAALAEVDSMPDPQAVPASVSVDVTQG